MSSQSSSPSLMCSPSSVLLLNDEHLDCLYVPVDKLTQQQKQKKKVVEFYGRQNEVLDGYRDIHSIQKDEFRSSDDSEANDIRVDRSIRFSFYCTIFLICLKTFIAIRSGSIAVISTAVDSGLDLLSQGTLLITSNAIKKVDPHNFPFGKSRLEPLGLVIFACIMGMASIQLFTESLKSLISGFSSHPIIIMDSIILSTILLVVLIQLCFYFYCKKVAKLSNDNNSAQALADDHINDVCINIIGGVPAIISGYVASVWWLDSAGGIGLSIYICIRWCITCYENIDPLIGKTAPPNLISQIVYLASNHHQLIAKVDTVLAYSVGYRYQVECHIVLPEDMKLKDSHDIAESLEKKIEQLSWVEMAFVHADYEYTHKAEHKVRKIKNDNNNNNNNNNNDVNIDVEQQDNKQLIELTLNQIHDTVNNMQH